MLTIPASAPVPNAAMTPFESPLFLWPATAGSNEQQHLTVGGCDVVELAEQHGTPLYLIDELTVRESCERYRQALARHYAPGGMVHYACKALLNTAVAQLINAAGVGFDVVSGGELYVLLNSGVPAARIQFHGNAKTDAELREAVQAGVGRIVVDNHDEIPRLAALARAAGRKLQLSLRVAPDVRVNTHGHIQTGHAQAKFGLPVNEVHRAVEDISRAGDLRVSGLHFHLGSQIFDLQAYRQGIEVVLNLAARLRADFGIEIRELSPGGGLGVGYTESEQPASIEGLVESVAQAVLGGCERRGLPMPQLVLEPGRSIVARAGVALYRIVGSKALAGQGGAVRYLHVDGGMADNIRPALYGARYTARLAHGGAGSASDIVHLSGRYCESSDILIREVRLPSSAKAGDLVAIPMSGAYTLSMASNYNGASKPAVLLVRDGVAKLIQRREKYADLVVRDVPIAGPSAGMLP